MGGCGPLAAAATAAAAAAAGTEAEVLALAAVPAEGSLIMLSPAVGAVRGGEGEGGGGGGGAAATAAADGWRMGGEAVLSLSRRWVRSSRSLTLVGRAGLERNARSGSGERCFVGGGVGGKRNLIPLEVAAAKGGGGKDSVLRLPKKNLL